MLRYVRSRFSCGNGGFILPPFAFFAIMGSLTGIVLATVSSTHTLSSLMRIAACSDVSIFGLMVVAFAPFLICLFAISVSKPWLFYPVCFLRLLLFSFCAVGINSAFGSAGWLMCGLLQFTDLCTLPLFLWFSYRAVKSSCATVFKDAAVYITAAAVIGIADHCLVSPFLVALMQTYETLGRFPISCWI